MTRRLMKLSKPGNRRRGFTLVELVIVGALIALFSGLAVFSVQQQFRSNTRKAVIGETRNIAAALDFANLDMGIFPKLCWLTESSESLSFMATQVSGSDAALYGTIDTLGRFPTGVALPTYATRIRNKWNGPYFAMSQARAGVAQGRGGFVYMLLEDLALAGGGAVGGNNVANPGGIRWPADPYNNAYVVYMLDIDVGTQRVNFAGFADGGTEPNRKGNFVNAVVSYGPNQVPGGEDFEVVDFGPRPTGDAAVNAQGLGAWSMRLYRGSPGFTPDAKGTVTLTLRPRTELTLQRAGMWNRDFATLAGSTLAPSGIGIADRGSDDIVFEF